MHSCMCYSWSLVLPFLVTCVPSGALQKRRHTFFLVIAAHREPWRQHHLQQLMSLVHMRLGVPVVSPIIPLVVGSEAAALELSRTLLLAGYHVPAIRPPTVPEGEDWFFSAAVGDWGFLWSVVGQGAGAWLVAVSGTSANQSCDHEAAALKLTRTLLLAEAYVPAIRPPMVPVGETVLWHFGARLGGRGVAQWVVLIGHIYSVQHWSSSARAHQDAAVGWISWTCHQT